MQLGSVVGVPGTIVRGKYPLLKLETGGLEELDVVIATGTVRAPSLRAHAPAGWHCDVH